MIQRLEKWTTLMSEIFNWVAAAAVTGMMLLTCMDIVLRLFRRPIPGTYEVVGFLDNEINRDMAPIGRRVAQ